MNLARTTHPPFTPFASGAVEGRDDLLQLVAKAYVTLLCNSLPALYLRTYHAHGDPLVLPVIPAHPAY
jgi:hypothetical protein